jgi:hypothetical protein
MGLGYAVQGYTCNHFEVDYDGTDSNSLAGRDHTTSLHRGRYEMEQLLSMVNFSSIHVGGLAAHGA